MADKLKLVRLKAPEGADEANYGEERFRVDNDGTVLVPQAAVADLVAVGGFSLIPEAPPEGPTPEGMIKVSNGSGGGCSFGGVAYAPDADGNITVPAHAVAVLTAHGFSPVAA